MPKVDDLAHIFEYLQQLNEQIEIEKRMFPWLANHFDRFEIDIHRSFLVYKRLVFLLCRLTSMQNALKLTILQNKSRKFNEWLFDPDHYAGRWHKKNMLRDFQDS